MKLSELKQGDEFRLLGDPENTELVFMDSSGLPIELYFFCYDKQGKPHYFVGYSEV